MIKLTNLSHIFIIVINLYGSRIIAKSKLKFNQHNNLKNT